MNREPIVRTNFQPASVLLPGSRIRKSGVGGFQSAAAGPLSGSEAARGRSLLALAAALVTAVALLVAAAPASAATGHSVLRTFSTGPNTGPRQIATDSSGNVYVLNVDARRIDKFAPTGERLSFTATVGYVNEGSITGTPSGPFDIAPWAQSGIAVDRSGGASDGYIYFARTDNAAGGETFVFAPSGAYLGRLGPVGQYHCGAAVNQATGQFYEANEQAHFIYRFPTFTGNPVAVLPDGQIGATLCNIAVDSSGAVYAGANPVIKYNASQFSAASPTPEAELPVSAAALAVDPVSDALYVNDGSQLTQYSAAGAQQGAAFGNLTNSRGVAGAGNGEVLATDSNGGVFVYGPAEVALPTATTGGSSNVTASSAEVAGSVDPDGAGTITGCEIRYGEDSGYSTGSVPCAPAGSIASPTAVSAVLTGLVANTTYRYRVFATNANGTQMASSDQTFTTEAAVAGVTTEAAADVAKDGATLNGSFTGDGTEAHYFFEWGATTAYGHTTPVPPGASAGSGTGTQNVAPIQISGLHASTVYHYRLVVSNAAGVSRGQDESFTTPIAVANLTADPATAITNQRLELNASFDADSYEVRYYFEWGPTTNYGNVTPALPGTAVPPGSGRVSVPSVAISGLQEGATYHYRVVATNATGIVYSSDAIVKTAEPPLIGGLDTRNVTATSAELVGEINPRSSATNYFFEWGINSTYGNKIPVPEGSIGAGTSLVPVSALLENLSAGVTYHFRLVATNSYGTAKSSDQSFGFYPPACPNAQLRQETHANSLPDCRAYELVTPSNANGTNIYPLGGPATGYATNPSKIAFSGSTGILPGAEGATNVLGDLYVATRSDTGWFQKYIGLPARESFSMGGPPKNWIWSYSTGSIGPSTNNLGTQASPDMTRIIDYSLGWPSFDPANFNGYLRGKASNAPYVWNTSTGQRLGRWPTNLSEVPDGEEFVGEPQASTDFSHFVFSANKVFAPGGQPSSQQMYCCFPSANISEYTGPPKGSVYDNDLETGAVVLASRKGDPAETPFEGFVFDVSEDGSRILMAEETNMAFQRVGQLGPTNKFTAEVQGPLYLRADAAHTYEIAPGHKIRYVGSSGDGSIVYLTSKEQLTLDDTDASQDLFVWREGEPNQLTLVSKGSGGAGNSDACSVGWTERCDVGIINFSLFASNIGGDGGNGTSDNFIASKTGEIYFESPEQLDGPKGEFGAVNLYLYREGTVRFVASMQPGHDCVEVVPFQPLACSEGPVARMQVTPDGRQMAFVTNSNLTSFDTHFFRQMYIYDPGSGRVTCASCRPDGQAPITDTRASQNGLFQTEAGRVFFASPDPLVNRDTNEALDIYEYTEGKAQLISSGVGEGMSNAFGFQGILNRPGLVSVSANGTDVYFATIETLVTQDHNGSLIKIYNARTGGGFPADLPPRECVAADECHGPSSSPPTLPPDRTSANLGKPKPTKAAKKHKAKHRKHKKKKAAKKKQRQERQTKQGRK